MVSSWEWHAYFSLGHLCPKISKRHKHFLGSVHTSHYTAQCTEVRFASFFSGGFTTMAVINPPENKLAHCTSVHCNAALCPKHYNELKSVLLCMYYRNLIRCLPLWVYTFGHLAKKKKCLKPLTIYYSKWVLLGYETDENLPSFDYTWCIFDYGVIMW